MAETLCERTRSALSGAADGQHADLDRAHVESCATCASFESGIRSLRSRLRFEVLDDAPDVAPRVLDRVSRRRQPRRWVPAAAAFVAGALLGSAFVWPTGGRDVAVASLPARVVAAQREVASVSATITVVDAGGTRTGTLRYRAPETLELRIGSQQLAVGDGISEPFSGAAPVPLELVLPVAGFTGATDPVSLGTRELDGREAIGVRVTAAQVDALVDGLLLGADAHVHPTDVVDLWLDRAHLLPLAVVVRAAPGPDRARWAAARGGADAGDVVLRAHLRGVVINDARSVDDLRVPAGETGPPDGQFREGPVAGPSPAWLPDGMQPWRAGSVGDVLIATWTDGRAWLKVRSTRSWRDTHLFGDVGRAVRPLQLGDGIAYAAEGGTAVAIHGDEIDVVVTGSVGPAALRRVAASLGVRGERVPDTWDEAATATVAELSATRAILVLPEDAGFAPPAGRLDGSTASLVFVGPGERAFVLANRPGTSLPPPLDPDAVGVVVRGLDGRWSPARGDLEWVEGDQVWSLRTTTIGLAELLDLTSRLGPP